MMWQRYKLKVLTCFVILLTVIITGCSTHTPSIVNTQTLEKREIFDEPETRPNHEMIKLNNGVVIYRDRSSSKKSSSDSQAASVHFNFGPKELDFDHNPVFKK
ncbi:MAG: hypothetical protein ACD_20C00420G0005 [uncultured bacterium]|nr:MAG: hypothetical protein ACD_20C00420G0005 [uncultured bacterium]